MSIISLTVAFPRTSKDDYFSLVTVAFKPYVISKAKQLSNTKCICFHEISDRVSFGTVHFFLVAHLNILLCTIQEHTHGKQVQQREIGNSLRCDKLVVTKVRTAMSNSKETMTS